MTTAITSKVRKILDKAASTTNEAERDTFFAAAQRLIATHNIQDAALRAAGTVQSDEIVSRDFTFTAPYAVSKMLIAYNVAVASGIDGVRDKNKGVGTSATLTLFGTASAMETFAFVQQAAVAHCVEAVKRAEVPSWENTKSFRAAFLKGYGNRLHTILSQAASAAKDAARASMSADEAKGVALVLVDDATRVKQAMRAEFATVGKSSYSSGRSYSGRSAGANAANKFNGHRQSIGSRKALSA